jgi:hypothetical protein
VDGGGVEDAIERLLADRLSARPVRAPGCAAARIDRA